MRIAMRHVDSQRIPSTTALSTNGPGQHLVVGGRLGQQEVHDRLKAIAISTILNSHWGSGFIFGAPPMCIV
jgi:hypothetical protein